MTTGIVQEDGSINDFSSRPFQQTVNVVCIQCNNGWMADLEGSVKQKLGPMIQSGRVTRLTPRTQRSLATWAVKTAFMMQHLHPTKNVIPDSEHRRFHAIQQPPRGYGIFLARTSPDIDGERKALVISHTRIDWYHTRWGDRMAFDARFAIGHIVFSVYGHNIPVPMDLQFPEELGEFAQRIWPIQQRVTWPPTEMIGDKTPLHNFIDSLPGEKSSDKS